MYRLKRLFFKIIGKNPLSMPMVQYWKNKLSVQAKVIEKNGVLIMKLDGEKKEFPGFPRGYLLYSTLSKLKHEIKNQIFNVSWAKLEKGESIVEYIKKEALPNIYEIFDKQRYEVIPIEHCVLPVREIHRAMIKVSPEHKKFADLLAYILQEDDAYRFRVQWIVGWFGFLYRLKHPTKALKLALEWLETAEVIDDMKERIRLLKRVILEMLEDKSFGDKFNAFFKECDWKKVKLKEADKFHFRGKYFKVDLDRFEY